MTRHYAIRLGAAMRTVRQQRGMTLAHVEKASGGRFRAHNLGAWERGTKNVSCGDLAAYAAWLGVDVRLLLPPEPDRQARLEAAAARAAEQAAAALAVQFPTVSPEDARALLTGALEAAS